MFWSAVHCQDQDVLFHSLTERKTFAAEEKIYVHTDKNVYVAGEILWFKLYVVNAANNHLFDLSKLAYVELTDSLNKPIAQEKIGLHNGLGDGSFSLPPSVSSGNFRFRAYTNRMKNEGADVFFEKN